MRLILVIMVFVIAVLLTACGSHQVALNVAATADGSNSPTATPSVSATLNVTMTDDSYDSASYTVPAGATVTVNLTNQGAAAHTFDILKKGKQLSMYEAQDQDKILWELAALPGETKSGIFTAPTEPGDYQIICRIPGHLAVGMTATLVVK